MCGRHHCFYCLWCTQLNNDTVICNFVACSHQLASVHLAAPGPHSLLVAKSVESPEWRHWRVPSVQLPCGLRTPGASLHNLMYRVQYRRLRVNDSAQTAQPQTYSPINLPSRLYRLESLCCSLGICGIIGFVILCHSLGLSKESNPLVCARYVRARWVLALKP